MFWPSEAYKHIIKNRDKSLKEIEDRIDCLQRSQVYIHNHITKVENDIDELKKLLLHRHTHFDSPGPTSQDLDDKIKLENAQFNLFPPAEVTHTADTETEPYDVQMTEAN